MAPTKRKKEVERTVNANGGKGRGPRSSGRRNSRGGGGPKQKTTTTKKAAKIKPGNNKESVSRHPPRLKRKKPVFFERESRPKGTETFTFRRPRQWSGADRPTAFPPTIFTDATYGRGVLVPNKDDECRIVDVGGGDHKRRTRDRGGDDDDDEDEATMGNGADETVAVEMRVPPDYFGPPPPSEGANNTNVPYGYGGYRTGSATSAGGGSSSSSRNSPRQQSSSRYQPTLTEIESKMWSHKNAAHAAAARHFPVEAVRLLGTITLRFEEKEDAPLGAAAAGIERHNLFEMAEVYSDEYSNATKGQKGNKSAKPRKKGGRGAAKKFQRKISDREARMEALAELGLDDETDVTALDGATQSRLLSRQKQIMDEWKDELEREPRPRREGWDADHGGFVREALGQNCCYDESESGSEPMSADAQTAEERHVPIPVLAQWIQRKDRIVDRAEGRVASLYGGLRHVPTDAASICQSLLDLSRPVQALYGVPLITPYAVARRMVEKDVEKEDRRQFWEVRIGVYANRLLFEVLTTENLHVVMSALDDRSYITSQPLHVPPMRDPKSDPVFDSAPYPVVKMSGYDDEKGGDNVAAAPAGECGGDDSSDAGEEKKEMDMGDDSEVQQVADAAVIGSTRETSWISAFTPKGLLKLLENTGNDTSMWPAISKRLATYLQLDLMLHQQHAICWMHSMESLGGMGINSILWEEREFLDGGKYYYSPALGQIRLGRPHATNGGVLADEMGLGKTIEVLGLIASTLGDLKKEAAAQAAGDESSTHATLIVVPPALAMQWIKEIKKGTGDKLKVKFLDARSNHFEKVVETGGKGPDIVITTYVALEQNKSSAYLSAFRWGRIVLDEMQEIRSSTTKIAKRCEKLKCPRRWMLSGTPLFTGIEDLRGELNFLRLEPYAASNEDGFFNFSIMNHWKMKSQRGLETLRVLGLVMLRRSKDMTIHGSGGKSIMDQRKLTVEFVPVAQSPSERALYCWMEHVVSQELKQGEDAKDMKSRNLCLRLLRELCFSAVLLNGGLGVSSQLKTINRMMVKAHRREEADAHSTDRDQAEENPSLKKRKAARVKTCDEALRFLTQMQSAANVGSDFVSDYRVNRGQGVVNRAHAMESVDDQIKQAESDLESASKKHADARRKRAKARWHRALELVTTGALLEHHHECRASGKFLSLWKWRLLCSTLDAETGGGSRKKQACPAFLVRGWRPSPSFLRRDVYASNPSFAWAHPIVLQLSNIPHQVTEHDIKTAVMEACKRQPQAQSRLNTISEEVADSEEGSPSHRRLIRSLEEANEALEDAIAHDRVMKEPNIVRIATSDVSLSTWKAHLQFADEEDMRWTARRASSKNGVSLKSARIIPHIQERIDKAKENLVQAESESRVYPCAANKKAEADAKNAYRQASLGLRFKYESVCTTTSQHVIMSRAVDKFRSLQPRSRLAQLDACSRAVDDANEDIVKSAARVESAQNKIIRLAPAKNNAVSQDVAQMSAFEILEALKENKWDKTRCPICLSSFGAVESGNSREATSSQPIVAMTSCGHFFCINCIEDFCRRQISLSRTVACPNCRRQFSPTSDVYHIDHLHDDREEMMRRREEAKKLVQEASHLLGPDSNGLLDGPLWHSLFLSFDIPLGISTRAHHIHTAIPREVLAHLRASTSMQTDCVQKDKPSPNSGNAAGLSSKIQTLLSDLPRAEHSVVFVSSKESVVHLGFLLNERGIPCFSLFSGQKPAASEAAVSRWEGGEICEEKAGPVLIIQAGAAAAGLTLTAASRMFLMEPFQRQEEEQQAYARCHRYGQRNDVYVKIYYAPVSVESRLLEWRRKAAKAIPTSNDDANTTSVVFSELFEVEESDDESLDVDMSNEGEGEGEIGEDPCGGGGQTGREESEDTRRSMFLLGLVDERGNPLSNDEEFVR